MKKAAAVFIILTITLMVTSLALFNIRPAQAAGSQEYTIERVDHKLQILNDGNAFLTDTIRIVGKAADETATLESFRMGFPYNYSQYIVREMSYNSSMSFQVNPNVPLEGRLGFYAVETVFPQPLSVKNGTEHVFTVGFILSNSLAGRAIVINVTQYHLGFPAYPSFAKPVTFCNVSLVLPASGRYLSGTVPGLFYSKQDLPAFTYSPGTVTFALTDSEMEIVNMKKLNRDVTVNELGQLTGSDTYHMVNVAQEPMLGVSLFLPHNASNVQAEDQFGRKMITPTASSTVANRYFLNFTLPLIKGNSTIFKVTYDLPDTYITKQQGTADSSELVFPLFQDINYLIEDFSAAFTLPEGAQLRSFEETSNNSVYGLAKGVFQDTLTVNTQDDMVFDQFDVKVVYAYNPLWLAFRPTLIMWALALVGCAVIFVWRRPSAAQITAATGAVRLRPEHLREFVGEYEEKMKIILELDALEAKVQKGKIPRRRYKVQKKTLETRLNTLSRSLAGYKDQMQAAGSHYSDLMLQLEVAESEIKEADAGARSIEAAHSHGELSLEAYRKRLEDYQRRKENAEATINGILLRFREETP